MGLGKRDVNSIKYVRMKEGHFCLKDDPEFYDELTGILTDISVKMETFEGKDVEKIRLTIESEGINYIVSVPMESSYVGSLIGFLKNSDLSEEITLKPMQKDEKDGKGNDVKRKAILVMQNGVYAKSPFSKDGAVKLPEFKKVKISGKEVWDKTDYLEALKAIVTNELSPKANVNKPKTQTITHVESENTSDKKDEGESTDVDGSDLPF